MVSLPCVASQGVHNHAVLLSQHSAMDAFASKCESKLPLLPASIALQAMCRAECALHHRTPSVLSVCLRWALLLIFNGTLQFCVRASMGTSYMVSLQHSYEV